MIALSRQAERYESNNQPAEARQVFRQIAEELGVVGGAAKGKEKDVALPDMKSITLRRTVVHPKGEDA